MSLSSFRNECLQRILDLLWEQWTQLGVASAHPAIEDNRIADPEALLLASCTIARWDPRLFDEVVDWTIENSNFINFPRLKSLLRKAGFHGGSVMSAISATVSLHNKRLNWKLDAVDMLEEPLFLSVKSGASSTSFGDGDAVFEHYGFTRGPFVRRKLSRRFNPSVSACAVLRLRSLIGTSARAEVLIYLLTHDRAHPSQIARDTGYSQKNVQDCLVDMTASGLVAAFPVDGRRIAYRLMDRSSAKTSFLCGNDKVVWVNWVPIYVALEDAWIGLTRLDAQSSELVTATHLRELKERLEPHLLAAGLMDVFSPQEAYVGLEAISRFQGDLTRFVSALSNAVQ